MAMVIKHRCRLTRTPTCTQSHEMIFEKMKCCRLRPGLKDSTCVNGNTSHYVLQLLWVLSFGHRQPCFPSFLFSLLIPKGLIHLCACLLNRKVKPQGQLKNCSPGAVDHEYFAHGHSFLVRKTSNTELKAHFVLFFSI